MRIPPDLNGEWVRSPLLYRALRKDEVEAGCIVIPKGQGPFAAAYPRANPDSRRETPEERAARRQRWRQTGCPSRGVSTTPHLERARRYAPTDGVIVELDRRLFESYWIREYPVNEVLARFPEDIAAPENEEVILVCELEGAFLKEIVTRVLQLGRLHRRQAGSVSRADGGAAR